MIEIRWQKETRQHRSTLQYRIMENPQEIGIQDPIWSEWGNVPTVVDGKHYSTLNLMSKRNN